MNCALRRLWLAATIATILSYCGVSCGAEAQHLLNVNFGSGTKLGLGAVGNGTNDVWNLLPAATNVVQTYTYYDMSSTVPIKTIGVHTNLLWANSNAASGVSVTITNFTQASSTGSSDAMMNSFLYQGYVIVDYDWNEDLMESITIYPNPSITVSNLPAGTYNLLVYALGAGYSDEYYNENGAWQAKVGNGTPTGWEWTTHPGYVDDSWAEGTQYVMFTNLVVTNGQVVTLESQSGSWYTHVLNGLQIIDPSSTNTTPTLPAVTFDPVSGTGTPVSVSLTVSNHNDATIYYTTNGTTPTTGSYVYSSALSFEVATTIKAFATKSGYNDSSVATATYPLSQLPLVSFNPTDGAGLPTNVVLTVTGHTNATIYFTTNGTTPTTSSTVYTGPIELKTNGWSYSANRVAAMTSFTTPSGSTVSNSTVLASSGDFGWKAFDHSTSSFWTADGTGPEWVSIEFPSTRRVAKYAIVSTSAGDAPKDWTLEGWNGSSYVVVDTRSSETNWSGLERREYVSTNSAQYLKYRLNISAANATSVNTGAYVRVGEVEMYEASIMLQAFAVKTNWTDSDIAYANYHARPEDQPQIAPTPFINPAGGTFNNNAEVTISSTLGGASYEYTTNGTDWVSYSGAFTLDRNTTLRAKTLKGGYATSQERTNSYTFVVATPSISPNGGNFTNSVAVTLASTTTGASLEYKIGGGNWEAYSGPITITNTALLTVAGDKANYTSSTNTATFTAIDTNAPINYGLINLNFGSGTRTGLAATGVATNDVWNTLAGSALTTVTNLVWANGSNSLVTLTISNLPTGGTLSGHSDTMLNTHVHGSSENGALLVISNLPAGDYRMYLYSLRDSVEAGSQSFQTFWEGLSSGVQTVPVESFDIYNDPLSEGHQFTVFTNISVTNGPVVVELRTTATDHLISGLQILAPANTNYILPSVSFSPASGTAPIELTLSVAGHGDAAIHYTTNGGDPRSEGTAYSGPFTLTMGATVKAVASKAGYVDSAVSQATYLPPQLPVVSFSTTNGTWTPNLVSMAVTGHVGAVIYYTTNGATPTVASLVYSNAVAVSFQTVFKALATKAGYQNSEVSEFIIYDSVVQPPSVTPAGGTFSNAVALSISPVSFTSVAWASTNNSDWFVVTNALILTNATEVRAKAIRYTTEESVIVTNNYSFAVADTSILPNTNVFRVALDLTLVNPTTGASIQYALDGGSWSNYAGTFALTRPGELTVIASRDGFASKTNTFNFTQQDSTTNVLGKYLNINFGSGSRYGTGAVGYASYDYWNTIGPATNVVATYTNTLSEVTPIATWGRVTNLYYSDGRLSGVTVDITNLTAVVDIGHSDKLMGTYLASEVVLVSDFDTLTVQPFTITANPKIVVRNLPGGNYSFYLFGAGTNYHPTEIAETDYEVFSLKVGSGATSTWKQTQPNGDLNSALVDGEQYVAFTNIVVSAGQDVVISLGGNELLHYLANGIQIVNTAGNVRVPQLPKVLADPPSSSFMPLDLALFCPGNPSSNVQYLLPGQTNWLNYSSPVAIGSTNWSYMPISVQSAEVSASSGEANAAFEGGWNYSHWLPYTLGAEWIEIEWSEAKVVSKYAVTAPSSESSTGANGPKAWKMEGWDGTQYQLLDERSNEFGWQPSQVREFVVQTNGRFQKNRLTVTEWDIQNIYSPVGVGEVSFYEAGFRVRARASQAGYLMSETNEFFYSMPSSLLYQKLPQPTVSLPAGVYAEPITVEFDSTIPVTDFRYSTNGSEWHTNASVYLNHNATLLVQGFKPSFVSSDIVTNVFEFVDLRAPIPLVWAPGGTYRQTTELSLYSTLEEATYRYATNNGSFWVWTTNNSLKVPMSMTVLAQTKKYGYADSWIITNSYVINTNLNSQTNVLLNLNLGGETKVGYAATGRGINDVWNLITISNAVGSWQIPLTNLVWANSSNATGVSVRLKGFNDSYSYNFNGDAMLTTSLTGPNEVYVGESTVQSIAELEISNLPEGTYDLYFYSVYEYQPTVGESYQVIVGSNTNAWKTINPNYENVEQGVPLVEPLHFVRFANVSVPAGQRVKVMMDGSNNGMHLVNGVQIVSVSEGLPELPAPTVTPIGGVYTQMVSVGFSSPVAGSGFRYWYYIPGRFSSSNPVWTTNQTVDLLQDGFLLVQGFKEGYSLSPIVTNQYSIVLPQAPAPIAYPAGGEYAQALEVTLFSGLTNASYRYSTNNGSSWTTNETVRIRVNTTVIAQTIKHGYIDSAKTTNTYTINGSLTAPVAGLLNLNLGNGNKVGFAAHGATTNDVWNLITLSNALASWQSPLTNMVWANSSNAVNVGIRLKGFNDTYGYNFNSDEMLSTSLIGPTEVYLGESSVPVVAELEIRNLPGGTYDLYFYSVYEYQPTIGESYQVIVGDVTNAWKTVNPNYEYADQSVPLNDPLHYVKFASVAVPAGEPVRVFMDGSNSGTHLVNGLQIVPIGDGLPLFPTPTVTPGSGTYTQMVEVAFSSPLAGAGFRYNFNGTGWVTNQQVDILESGTLLVQAFREGYQGSQIVTNVYEMTLPQAPVPAVYPAGGEYAQPIELVLFSALAGADYQYSIDNGTNWITGDTLKLTTNTTVLAQTIKYGYADSELATNVYVIDTNLTNQTAGVLNFNFGSGTKLGFAANGASTNDVWNLVAESAAVTAWQLPLTNLVWASGTNATNVTVKLKGFTDAGTYNFNGDTMLSSFLSGESYVYEGESQVEVRGEMEIRNLPGGTYDLYIYSVYENPGDLGEGYQVIVGGVTNGWQWIDPDLAGQTVFASTLVRDRHYVLFRNVTVPEGERVVVQMQSPGSGHLVNGIQFIPASQGVAFLPEPQISPVAEYFTNAVQLTLSSSQGGASYVYSTNGSVWYEYSTPFEVDGAVTVYAQTWMEGYMESAVIASNLVFKVAPTVVLTNASTTNASQIVTLTNDTVGSAIYYSLNGGAIQEYSEPFSISMSTLLTTIATKAGYLGDTNMVALLSDMQGTRLLNINFGGWNKVGFAATGFSNQDRWNGIGPANNVVSNYTYSDDVTVVPVITYGTTTNVIWSDDVPSPVAVSLTNLLGNGFSYHSDAMLGSFLISDYYLVYDYDAVNNVTNTIKASPSIVIQHLPTNTYDIYIYGVGNAPGDDDGYQVRVGGGSPSSVKRTLQNGIASGIWEEGRQFVKFTNLTVNASEAVTITLAGNYNYSTLVNGLQIVQSARQQVPPPVFFPNAGTYHENITVNITNALAGAEIYYSTNGSNWMVYTGSIPLSQTVTIQAYAEKLGFVKSETVSAHYNLDIPPTIVLESPIHGESVQAGASVRIKGSVFDTDGVATIQFLDDGAVFWSQDFEGNVQTRPFDQLWQPSLGQHYLTVRAVDRSGKSSVSEARSIYAWTTPVVQLISPTNLTTYVLTNTSVSLQASVDNVFGDIETVEFLANSLVVAEAGGPGYSTSWTPTNAGTFKLEARAKGGGNNAAISASKTLLVGKLPTVTWTYPTNDCSQAEDIPVILALSPASTTASVTELKVYYGTNVIAAFTGPPFTANIGTKPLGSYTYTAVVKDSYGFYATNTIVWSVDEDTDGDGVSDITEGRNGTDPNDYFNGVPPLLEIVSGNLQTGEVGSVGNLLRVKVTDALGRVYTNAPLLGQLTGEGLIAGTITNSIWTNSIVLRTATDGVASFRFKHGTNSPALNVVSVTGSGGFDAGGVSFSLQTVDTGSPSFAFAQVSMGYQYAVGVDTNGFVYIWGGGQILAPKLIPGLIGITNVTAGYTHFLAIDQNGAVRQYGLNGSITVIPGLTAVQVSAGHGYSMAISTNGTLWTWGGNLHGRMGIGSATGASSPVQVPGLSNVVNVSARLYHTLAVDAGGQAWAWGLNNDGQLGDGTIMKRETPVMVSGLSGVVQVAAAQDHSAALKADGSVWTWGVDMLGQLGDNHFSTNKVTPVQTVDLGGVVKISVGDATTFALKSNGTVWGWGYNMQGELGEPPITHRDYPVLIPLLHGVVDISAWGIPAGSYADAVLALKSDGSVFSWGDNRQGQLGIGSKASTYMPEQVFYYGVAVENPGFKIFTPLELKETE